MPQSDRRRQAFALADEIGLTDDERHDLAEIVLKKDCTSWGQLSDSQMERLVDAMRGWEYICQLLVLRT